MTAEPTIRHLHDAPEEVWDDDRGSISFRTAIGDGTTPTADLCSGVALIDPGGWLAPHRHQAPEVYQVLTGLAVVTLDGEEHEVRGGAAVFIPSNCEHGIRNTGDTPLELVYVYATDSVLDVEYSWSSPGSSDIDSPL